MNINTIGILPHKTDKKKALYTAGLTFLLIIIATFLSKGSFFSLNNFRNLLFQNAILGVVALGQLLVIMSGGIDLSIGSTIGLSTVLIMGLQDYGLGVAVLVAFILCGLVGLINGYLVSVRKLPAFVVTLGMMLFVFSLAQVISGGSAIYKGFNGTELAPFLAEFNARSILGIPFPAVAWLLFLLLVAGYLRTSKGHFLYAYGGNEKAAYISGIPVKTVGILAFVLGALLACAGGFLSVARVAKGTPSAGTTYLIDSIAAVAIGGASLSGGLGSVIGTLMGVLILGILNNIMNLIGVSPMMQPAAKGIIILLAVYLNSRKGSE